MADLETFRTLYVDPGETTGWCMGRGFKLLAGGMESMWPFADEVAAALKNPDDPDLMLNSVEYGRPTVEKDELLGPIGRIVMEDFRLYRKKAMSLVGDPLRTVRLIGALHFIARVHQVPVVYQPASIKDTAERAGAHELYVTPQYENRHHNDAIQHFVFYTHSEMRGNHISVPSLGVTQDG